MSTRFLELCGIEREVLADDPSKIDDRIHPDDLALFLQNNQEALEKKSPFDEECRIFVHGSVRWIHIESIPRELPDGSTIWEGVLSDITDRKNVAAELAAAREREKDSEKKQRAIIEQKLKTSLNAAAIAHEINQPLSRILLRARLGLEKTSSTDKETLEALIVDAEAVVSTIDKMKALLRNVETKHSPIDLTQIITSSIHQLKQPIRNNNITLTQKCCSHECFVMGDAVQLQMVFTNILRNAIEAITHSNPTQRIVSLECLSHDDSVELLIGDSGPGWPGGSIDEILLATSKPEGSGVGLYIVKTALENHNGTLKVEASPLGGALFRISLPCYKPAAHLA